AVYRAARALMADDDEALPVELGRNGLGLGFELEIARLELGLVALEALAIGLGGAQGLALGEQVVAGEGVLDVDDIAHLSEAPDALEQNDLHVRHSYPCHIVPLLRGGWGPGPGRWRKLMRGSAQPAKAAMKGTPHTHKIL